MYHPTLLVNEVIPAGSALQGVMVARKYVIYLCHVASIPSPHYPEWIRYSANLVPKRNWYDCIERDPGSTPLRVTFWSRFIPFI